jgi:predicted transcriptional regulator
MTSNSPKKREYDKDILDCLYNHSFGLTITDIADKINTTRNTVYRYLALLEGKDLVFKKKVGRYVLYFSKDKSMEFPENLRPIYKSFMKNLNKEFSGKESSFKAIGINIADTISFPIHIEGWDDLDSLNSLSMKELFEKIKILIPPLNLFDNQIDIHIINLEIDKQRTTYQITNSIMLGSKDYLYNFYILAGILEGKLSSLLKKEVKCILSSYEIFKNKKDSYLNLIIEIR